MRSILERLGRVLGLLLALTASGTVGYRVIEGWSWSDALYMTVITLSTVGFEEAQPLSVAGRWFTIALIVSGTGGAIYLLTLTAQLLLDGELRRTYRKERMAMRIRDKRDHVIVGGFGRYGEAVVEELLGAGRAVVVVDRNPDLIPTFESRGLAHVIASASSDAGLVDAGIQGASAIVAATPSDAENVFITLAAKELNPSIRVHARCESESAASKLVRAGADQVVSPFQMGGARTAASILRPAVVDFLEILSPRGAPEVDLEQIVVADGSTLVASPLDEIERNHPSLRIVALRRDTQAIQIAPPASTLLEPGDLLVVIGERPALFDLATLADAPRS